jgi:hypothetical protein
LGECQRREAEGENGLGDETIHRDLLVNDKCDVKEIARQGGLQMDTFVERHSVLIREERIGKCDLVEHRQTALPKKLEGSIVEFCGSREVEFVTPRHKDHHSLPRTGEKDTVRVLQVKLP